MFENDNLYLPIAERRPFLNVQLKTAETISAAGTHLGRNNKLLVKFVQLSCSEFLIKN